MIDQTVQEAEWTLCHLRREIPKKIQMQLNALSTEDLGMTLTDEDLGMKLRKRRTRKSIGCLWML